MLVSAGSATLLAVITVAGATRADDELLVPLIAAWWLAAVLGGIGLGRGAEVSPPVRDLLTQAKSAQSLPEQAPARILANRLWPLLAVTLLAAVAAVWWPQIAGIAAGFAMAWTLAWRRQDGAVAAIEDRDGVAFYVERTSPVRAIKLVRAPGLRRDRPELEPELA